MTKVLLQLMPHRLALAAIGTILMAAASTQAPVAAWGNDGHRIVCEIAVQLLSPGDRHEANRLAKAYRAPDNTRASSFSQSCLFADKARNMARADDPALKELWRDFSPFDRWHFLNLPRTARTVDPGDCRDDCVLHAVQRHLNELRDTSRPDWQRGIALMLLGHWLGDVHQPLHVSFTDDRGGNTIKPIMGYPVGDLHAVWDTGIIATALSGGDWWTYARTLRTRISAQDRREWAATPMDRWAQESHDIATSADVRYCEWSGNQCGAIAGGRDLAAGYQAAFKSVVENRLQRGGARLAALIEQSLH